MKTAAVATTLASAMAVSAQNIQSKPFNIQLTSDDTYLNGLYIGACHAGAAIEMLCLGKLPVTMHINSTSAQDPDNGLLTWRLPSDPPVDSAMQLALDPASNVALAFFYPDSSRGQYVQFVNDKLTLYSTVDDTKFPVEAGRPKAIENWYICDSYDIAYPYKTLSWVYGKADPQNPTCVKVTVKRNFE